MLHFYIHVIIHNHKLETLYLMYGVKSQHGVIWGHRGQILIFTKNALSPLCNIAYPCNSYIIISLRPSTYVMGSEVNLGSFGVTGSNLDFHKIILSPLCCIGYPCNSYTDTGLKHMQ